MRKVCLQVHRWLGLVSGLVVALMALSGVGYAFEPQLRRAWGEPITVPAESTRLSPAQVLARLQAQGLSGELAGIFWDADPRLPVWVRLQQEAQLAEIQVDPYSGTYLPEATEAAAFFRALLDFHRTLGLGEGVGTWVTGLACVGFGLVGLSGLFISLPWKRWRQNYRLPLRPQGRGGWLAWHRALGWWLLPLLVLFVLTGLVWAFKGYQNLIYNLTLSAPPPPPPVVDTSGTSLDLAACWESAAPYAAGALNMRLVPPSQPGQPARFEWQAPGDASSVRSVLFLHPLTGEPLRLDAAADYSPGHWLIRMAYPLHTGRWLGAFGQTLMAAAALSVPLLAATGFYLYLKRPRRRPLSLPT